MNVKLFNDNIDFFIFTTNKEYAIELKSFCTSDQSIEYWQKVIDILKSQHLETNFLPDEKIDSCAIDLMNEYKLADDELAYYIDKNFAIIENFLPFDNARLNALIKNNIAPYTAETIGVFKIIDGKPAQLPHAYILIDTLKKSFARRLYRVGLMSDIHYEDTDISDHGANPDEHSEGSSQPISDVRQVLNFYQNKEDVKFVCCAGDVTTDNMSHLLNFKAMTIKNMPTTPFYSCFGNHDFRMTSKVGTITNEDYLRYKDLGMDIDGKNRLQLWNSVLTPLVSQYEVHYQNPETEYGKTSFWFEVPTTNGKSDIYAFLSVNYIPENSDRENVLENYVLMSKNDIAIDTSKQGYNSEQQILEPTSEYNIALKFTNVSQRFKYDYHAVSGYTHTVRINKYKVLDANGNDVTSQINSSSPGIGMFGSDNKYHLGGVFEAMTTNAGNRMEFPLNSKFSNDNPDITLPVTYYANVELCCLSTDPYSEYRNSRAYYKLTENDAYMQEVMNYVGYSDLKGYDLKLYDNAALLWLKDLLESHTSKRIFIFTHQFFPQKAGGNYGNGYSYSIDNGRITADNCYCMSGVQFDFLNKLNNNHKNTIWFTGHSHYDFDSQITDRYVMICNKDFSIYKPGDSDFNQSNRYMKRNVVLHESYAGKQTEAIITNDSTGYNVHIPSTTRPLASNYGANHTLSVAGDWNSAKRDLDSAGLIMDIYEDYVDIRGITFKLNDWYPDQYVNKYHPLGQYRIEIPSK